MLKNLKLKYLEYMFTTIQGNQKPKDPFKPIVWPEWIPRTNLWGASFVKPSIKEHLGFWYLMKHCWKYLLERRNSPLTNKVKLWDLDIGINSSVKSK